jgi:hypothetical protein
MKVSHYTAKCVRLRVEELERRIAPSYLVDAPGPFGLTVRGTNVSIPGVLRPANSARVLARLAPYSNERSGTFTVVSGQRRRTDGKCSLTTRF